VFFSDALSIRHRQRIRLGCFFSNEQSIVKHGKSVKFERFFGKFFLIFRFLLALSIGMCYNNRNEQGGDTTP
jgi:hypothetical protein